MCPAQRYLESLVEYVLPRLLPYLTQSCFLVLRSGCGWLARWLLRRVSCRTYCGVRVCLAPRDGSIRYADFLRELEEGADEDDTRHRSPLRGSSPSWKNDGGGRYRGTGTSTSERGRLEASLSWAIERGIDYRREMELEEEGAGAGRETTLKEGIVSRQRRVPRSTRPFTRAPYILNEPCSGGSSHSWSCPSEIEWDRFRRGAPAGILQGRDYVLH